MQCIYTTRKNADKKKVIPIPLALSKTLMNSSHPPSSFASIPARFQTAEPISARQPALRPHVHKQPEKTTRVRTVLNEKQLHTLRTCYNANPRPDALMKEQLVEMTGLSPRVIRVWFQNKRCKDKKRSILMKQLQQQQPNDKTVRRRRLDHEHFYYILFNE